MKTKNVFRIIFSLALLSVIIISCSKDDDNDDSGETTLEVKTAVNIVGDTAKTGIHTLYSMRESKVIAITDSATDKWDIGFTSSASVIFNNGTYYSSTGQGGAVLLVGLFDELETAPDDGYTSELPGSKDDPTWYTFNINGEHIVRMIPGRVIAFKTADGKYGKMEMISYYLDNPELTDDTKGDDVEPRYFTFKYAIQPDGSKNLK
ncbi:MAG: hypothetical protein JXB49_37200 [Bacteroidales bacterium]|nr:hypothetical protein [Bacteroidales bacterium]